MYTSIKLLSIAALLGLASTASAAKVVIKNQCGYDLQLGKLNNGESDVETAELAQGSSKTYTVDSKWQGRFWAREKGAGTFPASLAELTFKGHAGYDFYDVSFVDGFNIPVSMEPINPHEENTDDKYRCGTPTCGKLPSCPEYLKVYEDGKEVGCNSACSKFGTDEYCCAGDHDTPDKCPPSSYSKDVKESCPDVYTYAYDDLTSTYMCQADGYTVTFCP
ncbi:thaumatin [Fennellomyces sp. T-0311]|nr:thaumatin [Fennellomyces sp. T-0311]